MPSELSGRTALITGASAGIGAIVNVSSIAAQLSAPGEAAYDASKAPPLETFVEGTAGWIRDQASPSTPE